MIVYDMSRPETFEHLDDWLREVDSYCPGGARGVVKLVVGSKLDLARDGRRAISREDGAAWARGHGALFVETSAKANEGVRQAFEELVQKVLDNPDLLEGTAPAAGRTSAGVSLAGGDEGRDAPGAAPGEGGVGCC